MVNGRNHARLPLSGHEWESNQLVSYNVRLVNQQSMQFFGRPIRPVIHLPLDVYHDVGRLSIPNHLDRRTEDFLFDLRKVVEPVENHNRGERMVDLFGMSVLKLMGFEDRHGIKTTFQPITRFLISGVRSHATPKVVVWDADSEIYLVIQENKVSGTAVPEAQIIAEAIAAYQNNNDQRERLGLGRIEGMVIPCITLVGSRPRFYKVPVSKALNDAIITAQYPEDETIVTYCEPPPRDLDPGLDDATDMSDVEYRRTCLMYYAAFRDMARECWTPFLEGL